MKQFIIVVFMLIGFNGISQITLNACHPLIENQDFVLNEMSTDVTGRNMFESDPVDGNQPCGGIGSCEFRIAWNQTSLRWEIYADDGDGTFSNTFVLYYNTEASLPNPPSLVLGTWIEESTVTNSLCGAIMTLSGDVQDSETLGVDDEVLNSQIVVYPNPTDRIINIQSPDYLIIKEVLLYDAVGKLVLSKSNDFNQISVSGFSTGLYFLKVHLKEGIVQKKILIQ